MNQVEPRHEHGIQDHFSRLHRLDASTSITSSQETTSLLTKTRKDGGRGLVCSGNLCARCLMVLCQYIIIGGFMFCIEMPGGLQATIIRVTRITATEYNILFSGYAWPDIVMSITGGVIVDRYIGIRRGYVVFVAILMVGQGILALGGYYGQYYIMMAGRLLFGCGVGSATSIVTSSQVLLFDSRVATMVIAFNGAFMRFCAGMALFSSQRVYDWFGEQFHLKAEVKLGATLSVGFAFMFMGFLLGLLIALLDFCVVKKLMKQKTEGSDAAKDAGTTSSHSSYSESCHFLSILSKFSLPYWLVVIVGAVFYPVVFLLVANGQLFFVSKYGADLHEASLINSLNYAATICIGPFIGILIGLCKCHTIWTLVGTLLGLTSHLIFLLSGRQIALAYVAAVLSSISYSITMLSLYSLIGFLVHPSLLATAYGISLSVYDLFYCVLALLQGLLIDHLGFFCYEAINLTLVCVAVLVVVPLIISQASSCIGTGTRNSESSDYHRVSPPPNKDNIGINS